MKVLIGSFVVLVLVTCCFHMQPSSGDVETKKFELGKVGLSGYHSGRLGQNPLACPHREDPERRAWMEGWLRGDEDGRTVADPAP